MTNIHIQTFGKTFHLSISEIFHSSVLTVKTINLYVESTTFPCEKVISQSDEPLRERITLPIYSGIFTHVVNFLKNVNNTSFDTREFGFSLCKFPNNIGVLRDVMDISITLQIPVLTKICDETMKEIVRKHLKNPEYFCKILKYPFRGTEKSLERHLSYDRDFLGEYEIVESLLGLIACV